MWTLATKNYYRSWDGQHSVRGETMHNWSCCIRWIITSSLNISVPWLPTRRHQISNYNMRNPTNLIIEHTRTQSFKKSFIPASLSLWNNLPEHIRSSTTLTEFKRNTKPSVIKKREYSRGIGSGSIHLTRFRMNMSGLKSHLYACNIVDSDICGCGANNVEDVDHFIWLCPRHQGT